MDSTYQLTTCGLIFQVSDYISIASIICQILLGIWIVKKIQNSVTNNRVLKDLLIKEHFNCRDKLLEIMNEMIDGKLSRIDINHKLKIENIKINKLFEVSDKRYKTNTEIFKEKYKNLRKFINECETFKNIKDKDNKLKVSFNTSDKSNFILKFKDINNNFIDLIIKINDN